MADLVIDRTYPVSAEKLFDLVSTPEGLAQWFGPEGIFVDDCALDFTKPGPWFCVMVGRESGARFKVSGHVTHSDPPKSLGITWAWHDNETDARGAESHVTFRVTPNSEGAQLFIEHRDLADAEAVDGHRAGWLSSLRKLDAAFE